MQNPEAISGHSRDGAYSCTDISRSKWSVLLLVFKRNWKLTWNELNGRQNWGVAELHNADLAGMYP